MFYFDPRTGQSWQEPTFMDFAPADLEDLESWVTDQYTRTLSRYA
jgi:hypothetical protein